MRKGGGKGGERGREGRGEGKGREREEGYLLVTLFEVSFIKVYIIRSSRGGRGGGGFDTSHNATTRGKFDGIADEIPYDLSQQANHNNDDDHNNNNNNNNNDDNNNDNDNNRNHTSHERRYIISISTNKNREIIWCEFKKRGIRKTFLWVECLCDNRYLVQFKFV